MTISTALYRLYERRLFRQLADAPKPSHIGVMLDGNRRWARKEGYDDVADGHRAGAAHIADLLLWCQETGVGTVTLWLLSTDNLRRKDAELAPLLEIIADVVDELAAPGKPWRLTIVGALDLLPPDMATRLRAAELRTADRNDVNVNIAVGYGGRQEIVDAVRAYLRGAADRGQSLGEAADNINADVIAGHLYTSGQPDPELVIRTSGEQRIGGFLLWQSAHSEYWFCEAYWPDFRRVDFLRALRDYSARHRRFGA